MGLCSLAHSRADEPDHHESKAVAIDFEGHEAHLLTRPNFGCVQWEARR